LVATLVSADVLASTENMPIVSDVDPVTKANLGVLTTVNIELAVTCPNAAENTVCPMPLG
jgi:hypothetical protein